MQRSWIGGLLIAASLLTLCADSARAQGTRFRADWLFLRRDSDGSSQSLIAGPDPVSTNTDYNYESGYRLFFSAGTEQFDVEFQYSRLDDWHDQQGAFLFNELSFDDEFVNPNVVAAPPANILAFANSIYPAAEFNGGMGLDETLEGELLDAFSEVIYEAQTNYRDFDLTIKTTRANWYRFGIGYRHIQFDEANGLNILGTFLAIDADDGALPGDMNNDDNDGLSPEALASVGLQNTSGASAGFAHGDLLQASYLSTNDNELNGAHITFDGNLFDSSIFLVDIFGNLGLYHNQITARLVESYSGQGMNDAVYQNSVRQRENDLAWAAQTGIRGAVKLTDNLRVHLGYEVLFIDGLALGPNQPRVTTFSTIPIGADQSVLIHGGRLGFEAIW